VTDRRTFLRGGLVASLVGGVFRPSGYAAFAASPPTLVPDKVLVDGQVCESVAFGEAAESNDSQLRVFDGGDVSDVWYDELDLLWRQRRAPIVGLTRHGPLFVLERFAWDRGMRVVFRGEHSSRAGTVVVHQLHGGDEAVTTALQLVASGADWAEAMGLAAMVAHPHTGPARGLAFTSPGRLTAGEPLYSWVIA
jgi:hypothetical protein